MPEAGAYAEAVPSDRAASLAATAAKAACALLEAAMAAVVLNVGGWAAFANVAANKLGLAAPVVAAVAVEEEEVEARGT